MVFAFPKFTQDLIYKFFVDAIWTVIKNLWKFISVYIVIENDEVCFIFKNIYILIKSNFYFIAFWILMPICFMREINRYIKKRKIKNASMINRFITLIEHMEKTKKTEENPERENKIYDEIINILPEHYRTYLPKEQMITTKEKRNKTDIPHYIINNGIRDRRIIELKELGCLDRVQTILNT